MRIMKRLALLVCAFAILSCSSSTANVIKPEVNLYQLVGPADLNYPSGTIEVQFALRVENKSGEPITLEQIQMMPVGLGGPYRITQRTYYFNQSIAPNAAQEVPFWARATAQGDAYAPDSGAPVSLRAIAQFKSAEGASFQKILMKTFPQQGMGPREGH
jgi:hypothetical protein